MLILPLLACRSPGPAVATAAEIGTIEQSAWITGRDGGGSAVAFGQSVWVSGDTVLSSADERGNNWHNNSYSLTSDFDASDGIGAFTEPSDAVGAPREFMPETEFERTFNDAHRGDPCEEEPCGARWVNWPGNPYWDADHDVGLVLYGILYLGDDEEAHTGGGHSIARWEDVNAQPIRPVLHENTDFPDILWPQDVGDWGSASVIADGNFYAFSCDSDGLDRPCRLGRGPLDDVVNSDAWEYWDGTDWQHDISAATPLFNGSPIMSVSWNHYLDAWLLVYSPPFDGAVKARTAPHLSGPWSDESVVYDLSENGHGDESPYDANQHAEMAEQDGKVTYITWSRHTTGWFGSEFPVLRVEFE